MELNALIQDVPYETYAEVGGLRASDLSVLRVSPAHWKHRRTQPHKETQALRFGKLFHSAMEQGKDFRDRLVVEPRFIGLTKDGKESTQSKAAREKRLEWRAGLREGSIWVTEKEADALTGMIRSVLRHEILGNLLREGIRETCLFVECPETGELLQSRADWITSHGHILDFKTTRDAKPSYFTDEIYSMKKMFYALTAAHYLRCAEIANSFQRVCRTDEFDIVAIEKEPPFGIQIYRVMAERLGGAERMRANLTRLFHRCKQTDTWPNYSEEPIEAIPPLWLNNVE